MTEKKLKNSPDNKPTPEEVESLVDAAYRGNNTAIIKFLDKYNTAVDAKASFDRTALMYAAMLGKTDTVRLLLEKGANPDEKDNSNGTALMYAAENGEAVVVELLLKSGASLDNKNWHDKTAMDLALNKNRDEVVALLEQWPQRKHEQWLDDTDCSKGLEKSIPAPRPPVLRKIKMG